MSKAEDVRRRLLRVGATVLERGWLSSNNIVFAHGSAGSAVVDTGYCAHATQTVQLVSGALGGRPLSRIVNTHLHSDHCGGNAALQAAWGCTAEVPEPSSLAVRQWDERRLTYVYTGQSCPRFALHDVLKPGTQIELGGLGWDVMAAKGHDPDAVMLFQADERVLIAGDALWESRLAIVFPELAGHEGFSEACETFQKIADLDPAVVIPGHGPAFEDVQEAIAHATSLLAKAVAEPSAHHRHAARSLLMFHMLETRTCTRAAAIDWLLETPVFDDIWKRCDHNGGSMAAFAGETIDRLLKSGALRLNEHSALQVVEG